MMIKSEEMKRLEAALQDKEFQKKFDDEFRGLADTGEYHSDAEVAVKTAENLGYPITLRELEMSQAHAETLDSEELAMTAGGKHNVDPNDPSQTNVNCWKDYDCIWQYRNDGEDEYGHNEWCFTIWHCYTVTVHSETTDEDAACWSNYTCAYVSTKW